MCKLYEFSDEYLCPYVTDCSPYKTTEYYTGIYSCQSPSKYETEEVCKD